LIFLRLVQDVLVEKPLEWRQVIERVIEGRRAVLTRHQRLDGGDLLAQHRPLGAIEGESRRRHGGERSAERPARPTQILYPRDAPRSLGTHTWKTVPPASVVSTSMPPPWSSAMDLAREGPNPRLPSRGARSARW